MSDCAVVLYPDPRLAAAAEAVTVFDGELAALAARLVAALDTAPAIGLAAPHIGVGRRVIAVRLPGEGEARVYVNPEIAWSSPETEIHAEGSVSMPGASAEVARPRSVRIGYHRLDGSVGEETAEGFAAAVLCHEIDQLDGIFWTERVSRLRRERLLKRWRKHRG